MSNFVNSLMDDKKFLSEMVIHQVPIEQIKPDPKQVRQNFDEEKLRELADSIKEKGIQSPIHIRPSGEGSDEFVIIMGERRFRASQIVGMTHVPLKNMKSRYNVPRFLDRQLTEISQ